MRCPVCNSELSGEVKFCPKCGAKIAKQVCPRCGKPADANTRFCRYCGYRFSGEAGSNGSVPEAKKHTSDNPARKVPRRKNRRHKKGKIAVVLVCVIAAAAVCAGIILYTFSKEETADIEEDFYRAAAAEEVEYAEGNRYVSSELILTGSEGTKQRYIEKLAKKEGGEIAGYIGVSRDYQIYFPDGKTFDELEELIETWESDEQIVSVNLNYVSDAAASSVDYSGDPWQADNISESDDYALLESTETDPAWNVLSPGGSNWWAEAVSVPCVWNIDYDWQTVKVGIFDSMFDTTNEDLDGRFAEGGLFQNPDDVNALYQKTLQEADSGGNTNSRHGTGTAGVIGAAANNFGITGISQNSELYGFSYFGEDDYDYVGGEDHDYLISDMEMKYGIATLLEQGVKVINLSMSYYNELSVSAQYEAEVLNLTADDEEALALRTLKKISDVFSRFLSSCLDQYDFLLIQSAGNQNGGIWLVNEDPTDEHPFCCYEDNSGDYSGAVTNPSGHNFGFLYDSKYEVFSYISDENVRSHVINVGSMVYEINGTKITGCTESSFSARNADIYAPGENILTDDVGNVTSYGSGTSFSAPVVTGVAALIWGVNPDLTALEVRDILMRSTQYNAWNDQMVDAWASLSFALATVEDDSTDAADSFPDNIVIGYAYNEETGTEDGTDRKVIENARFKIYSSGDEEIEYDCSVAEDGTFTALLPADDYVIEVTADGYDPVRYSVTVEPGNVGYMEIAMTPAITPEEAYQSFMDEQKYTIDVLFLINTGYAIYDIDNDGVKELIIHGYADYDFPAKSSYLKTDGSIQTGTGSASCDQYYIYRYDGNAVTEVGAFMNWENGGDGPLYYSPNYNMIATHFRTSSDYQYRFFRVGAGITKDIDIEHDSPDQYEGMEYYEYSKYTDANQGSAVEMTKDEWDSYEDYLVEIPFTAFDTSDISWPFTDGEIRTIADYLGVPAGQRITQCTVYSVSPWTSVTPVMWCVYVEIKTETGFAAASVDVETLEPERRISPFHEE